MQTHHGYAQTFKSVGDDCLDYTTHSTYIVKTYRGVYF